VQIVQVKIENKRISNRTCFDIHEAALPDDVFGMISNNKLWILI